MLTIYRGSELKARFIERNGKVYRIRSDGVEESTSFTMDQVMRIYSLSGTYKLEEN